MVLFCINIANPAVKMLQVSKTRLDKHLVARY